MKDKPIKNIWMISREYGDLAGAGGVKDVAQQLAEALARWSGRKVRMVLPMYGSIDPAKHGFTLLADPGQPEQALEFMIDLNYDMQERRELCRVWTKRQNRVDLYLIAADRFREKYGVYTYTEQDVKVASQHQRGLGHIDYFAMNVLLQKSSLELMVLLGERPDIIHCHDGHTALIPALITECQGWRSYFRETGCVVTIHNAGLGYHQEVADLLFAQAITGLPWRDITASLLAGKFDPFISAGRHAVVNTVSENYARELRETDSDRLTEWLGHSLIQQGVVLEGITNGISPAQFNPAEPEGVGIAAAFNPADGADDLAGKKICKDHLHQLIGAKSEDLQVGQFGTIQQQPTWPLFTFIGRLSEQKGVDILVAAMTSFLRTDVQSQLVILGSGADDLEKQIIALVKDETLAGRVCFLRGYNPQLANMIYAAGDFFVIPSRYEPCGLTDYIAQLFGNLPIVHHVGGLVKVVDEQTGFAYHQNSPAALVDSLRRARQTYDRPDVLRRMQRDAVVRITKNFTWEAVMHEYLKLYKRAQQRRREH